MGVNPTLSKPSFYHSTLLSQNIGFQKVLTFLESIISCWLLPGLLLLVIRSYIEDRRVQDRRAQDRRTQDRRVQCVHLSGPRIAADGYELRALRISVELVSS
jgi:hypothetical protein